MKILVHRGRALPNSPGNTESDFEQIIQLGADGFETDVSETANQIIINYHPGTTEPDCTKLNWDDIARLKSKGKLPSIMTLDELLFFIKTRPGFIILLEVKIHSRELVYQIVRRITEEKLENRIYLTAFQRRSRLIDTETGGELLIFAKELNPNIRTQLIATFPFNLPAIARKYHSDAISFGWIPDQRISRLFFKLIIRPTVSLTSILGLTADLRGQIKWLKDRQIKVWGGIINTSEEMQYFADLGVEDGIITDNAALGIQFRKNWKIVN